MPRAGLNMNINIMYAVINDALGFMKVDLDIQIFSMLKEVSLGYSYIQIGLILRESNLISKLLLSCESWHRVNKYHVEWLEEVDFSFFRQLFNAHSKTCKEIYLIESGKYQSDS